MTENTSQAAGPPEPRANPELIGHEGAENIFLDSWGKGRLAHAWLITGPAGIGKATLAFRLARRLLENNMPQCQRHGVFRRVAAGSHADLFTLERPVDSQTGARRGEITVEVARKVAPFLHLTPAEAGWRVVIIDGADKMNRNAANAILKIVEEPPANTVILMTCEGRHKVLPTICSRCRTLALRPLDTSLMLSWLCRNSPELKPDQAGVLARISAGSPGHALRLADGEGLGLYEEMLSLFENLPCLDIAAAHDFADRLSRPRAEDGFRLFLELFTSWLLRLIRVMATDDRSAIGLSAEDALINRLATGCAGLDRWLTLWEKAVCLTAQTESLVLDRKQVLLSLFDSLEGVGPVQSDPYRL